MPDRVLKTDVQFWEHFEELHDASGAAEYSQDPRVVVVRCRHCTASWAVPLGEMGEIRIGDRNPLMAHQFAHDNHAAARLRRLTK